MNSSRIFAILLCAILPSSAFAQSEPDQQAQVEALSQCLTMKSTGSDRLVFAGWMVSAMASAPQLRGLAEVSAKKRDQYNRELAQIFTRMITNDCRIFASPLLKSGNIQAFGSAFEVFGRLAMQELTGNPEADRAMGEFAKYIDDADFEALRK